MPILACRLHFIMAYEIHDHGDKNNERIKKWIVEKLIPIDVV